MQDPPDTKFRFSDERGQAIVELAIILPVLAVILFGILDFGRILNYDNDLNQMAADGARFAAVNRIPPAVNGCTGTSMTDRIACQADTAELRDGSGAVTAEASAVVYTTGNTGDPVKVCATATYQPFTILGLGPTIHLRGSATMRLEQDASNYTPDGADPTADCP